MLKNVLSIDQPGLKMFQFLNSGLTERISIRFLIPKKEKILQKRKKIFTKIQGGSA